MTYRMPASGKISRILRMRHQKRLWAIIVGKEEQRHAAEIQSHNAACIVAFAAANTLPAVVASVVAAYIPKPIHRKTIQQISRLSYKMKKGGRPKSVRGIGELNISYPCHSTYEVWLRKNQQPRLRLSQPEFRKEIRVKAHMSLWRRLHLRGSVEEKLSNFFLLLLHEY